MTRTARQSIWWRLFAVGLSILLCVLLGRFMAEHQDGSAIFASATILVSCLGVIGFAFGFRCGPRLFWRLYALVFSLGAALLLGKPIQALAFVVLGYVDAGLWPVARLGSLTGCTVLLCIALLRHAELLSGGRQSRADPLVEVFA